jgi:predicted Zn-dependent protease
LNEEGLRLEHDGDLLGALDKYRGAVDLDPTGYGFRLNYALALCRLGRWQEGVTQLQEVLKEDPDNADAAKALFIAQEEVAKKKVIQIELWRRTAPSSPLF